MTPFLRNPNPCFYCWGCDTLPFNAEIQICPLSIDKIAKPGMDETEFAEHMIMQLLKHDGHAETARVFLEEIQARKAILAGEEPRKSKAMDAHHYNDAINRQSAFLVCFDLLKESTLVASL